MRAIEAFVDRLQSIVVEQDATIDGQPPPYFDREAASAVADELIALQAIYGDDRVSLLATRRSSNGSIVSSVVERDDDDEVNDTVERWSPRDPIRLAISIDVDVRDEQAEVVRLSAVLPPRYPFGPNAPQLQILSRYVGSYGVDHALFGQIVRIFMGGGNVGGLLTTSSPFVPGQVALFDGIEKARELIEAWLLERRRPDAFSIKSEQSTSEEEHIPINFVDAPADEPLVVKLFTAEAITERKSTFVGHAAVLQDPSDVARIRSQLLQDKRIARATHPTIMAWSVRTSDGILHRDCDDDGETAAGGRLAHLLDVLRLENVIVIVTRWYGGVLLGPDRFKFINRAARDALQLARLVEASSAEQKYVKARGGKTTT